MPLNKETKHVVTETFMLFSFLEAQKIVEEVVTWSKRLEQAWIFHFVPMLIILINHFGFSGFSAVFHWMRENIYILLKLIMALFPPKET